MIDWLSVEHFRNLDAARLEAGGGNVGIVGPNGSGKTSLLEALYVLSHGRSFRTAQRSSVIARAAGSARIVCGLVGEANTRIGIEVAPSRLDIKVAGRAGSLREAAALLPVQLVDPSVHLLVEEGAARRRKLLDWGVFHVEPRFSDLWRAYHRALRQRNAALRAQMWSVAEAMGEELASLGEQLHLHRQHYFTRLSLAFDEVRAELLDDPVEIEYYSGWPSDSGLGRSIAAARDKDRRLRVTSVGPHRADIRLVSHSRLARETVSRGQQKLLASALVISQARSFSSDPGRKAALLLDDPAAELDVDNLGKLFKAMTGTRAQIVATSLTWQGLEGLQLQSMFHVKQGRLTPMLYSRTPESRHS